MVDGGSKRQTLFFALWPNKETRSRLGKLARSVVEQKCGREVPHPNLHLTLLYLGPVEVERFDQIIARVPQFDILPFALQIDSAGFWRRPGVIWLGSNHTPAELTSLVESLRVAMRDAGFDFDNRPFKSHITVMRKATRGLGRVEIEPLKWQIERFSLMASQPVPGGVSYRELGCWQLKKSV